jgi:hypothetical protein
MEHSQYRQFQRRAQEGAKVVVFPTGDHDCIGCFADQVKLTRALVQDLDEVVKEVKLLGEHGEEASQKIMKLEALCKRLREDAQKLKEEKATLEGMVESRDELIMDITKETGLDHMGENAEDDNDRGDATALLFDVAPPPTLAPPAATPEENIEEEDPVDMVPEQEAPVAHEAILADTEYELPQPCLYRCNTHFLQE